MKQGARFYVNGKPAGMFENGVTACGLDLTGMVNFGAAENVLAVRVDNSNDYEESATGVGFEWMGKAFNPNYGGLQRPRVAARDRQGLPDLPLYKNLKTTGVYVYPSNFARVTPSQGDRP